MVGDDDYQDGGPPSWPQAERVARWTASVILHAAEAEMAHYEVAVILAQIVRWAAIIECSTATLPLWLPLVERVHLTPAILIVEPRDGGMRPILPPKGAEQ
jgi:hypothetical protein